MLYRMKELEGYAVDGYDGAFGTVSEFYFDDRYWTIRYLVADTGDWLIDRRVLISPYALISVDANEHHITVNLTKEQIEKSPPLTSDLPVSQQYETNYFNYFEWPMYWAGPYMWGAYPTIMRDAHKAGEAAPDGKAWDPDLRSTHEVGGYAIHASDGDIGHIVDFVIDEENWAIRYMVVDTNKWWPGKKVLVSTAWIKEVNWSEAKVFVYLSKEIIKQSPEFADDSVISRDYEDLLHRHYNRQGYWI